MSTVTYAPYPSEGGHIRGSSDNKPLEEGTIISCIIFLICLILAVLVRQYYLSIMPQPQQLQPWQKAVLRRRQAKLNARRRSHIKALFRRILKPIQDLMGKWTVPIVRWQVIRAGTSTFRRLRHFIRRLTARLISKYQAWQTERKRKRDLTRNAFPHEYFYHLRREPRESLIAQGHFRGLSAAENAPALEIRESPYRRVSHIMLSTPMEDEEISVTSSKAFYPVPDPNDEDEMYTGWVHEPVASGPELPVMPNSVYIAPRAAWLRNDIDITAFVSSPTSPILSDSHDSDPEKIAGYPSSPPYSSANLKLPPSPARLRDGTVRQSPQKLSSASQSLEQPLPSFVVDDSDDSDSASVYSRNTTSPSPTPSIYSQWAYLSV